MPWAAHTHTHGFSWDPRCDPLHFPHFKPSGVQTGTVKLKPDYLTTWFTYLALENTFRHLMESINSFIHSFPIAVLFKLPSLVKVNSEKKKVKLN